MDEDAREEIQELESKLEKLKNERRFLAACLFIALLILIVKFW